MTSMRTGLTCLRAHVPAVVRLSVFVMFLTGTSVGASAQPPESPQAERVDDSARSPAAHRQRLLAIEREGDSGPAALESIGEALKNKDTETRRLAVRTLGRLGRGSLTGVISQSLADPAPVVRVEAAQALVSSVRAGGDAALATNLLLAQLETESHPLTRGLFALALGRLRQPDASTAARVEQAIVAATRGTAGSATERSKATPAERLRFSAPLTLLGALRGLESFTRSNTDVAKVSPNTIDALRELVVAWRSAVSRAEGGPTADAAARLRRLALQALITLRAADSVTLSTAFGDGDEQVRRLAGMAAAESEPLDVKLFDRAIRDQSPMVRASALAALVARRAPETCGYVALAIQDPEPSVVIEALDAAAETCAGQRGLVATIAAMANRLAPAQSARGTSGSNLGEPAIGLSFRSTRRAPWQVATRALIALSSLAPDDARERVKGASNDSRVGVRRAVVTAAHRLRDIDLLRTLAADSDPSVGVAAAAALREQGATGAGGAAPSEPAERGSPGMPSASDLETLNSARLIVTVQDVGRFEIRLLPQEAALHAWWFYRLARDKALNGLTIGRSAELVAAAIGAEGAASVWRARPGRAEENLQVVGRGTVGVRRPASGAPVLFIGVADDPPADTETTVFGQVERGVDVLDALFPDDVIERVDVSTRPE